MFGELREDRPRRSPTRRQAGYLTATCRNASGRPGALLRDRNSTTLPPGWASGLATTPHPREVHARTSSERCPGLLRARRVAPGPWAARGRSCRQGRQPAAPDRQRLAAVLVDGQRAHLRDAERRPVGGGLAVVVPGDGGDGDRPAHRRRG